MDSDFGDSYFGDDFGPPTDQSNTTELFPWADPLAPSSTTTTTTTTTTSQYQAPVDSPTTTTTTTSSASPAFNYNAPPTFSTNSPPTLDNTPTYTAPPTTTTTSTTKKPSPSSPTITPSFNPSPEPTPSTNLFSQYGTTTTSTSTTTKPTSTTSFVAPPISYNEIPQYTGSSSLPSTLVAATYDVITPNYYNNNGGGFSDPMAPPAFDNSPPIYSSPSHTTFQANALYQAIEASSGLFFRTGFPSPPVLNQDVASLYPLAPYEDPNEIDIIEYGVRKLQRAEQQLLQQNQQNKKKGPKGKKKKRKRAVNPDDSAASSPSHDVDSFLLDDDGNEPLDGSDLALIPENELTSTDVILAPYDDISIYEPPTLERPSGEVNNQTGSSNLQTLDRSIQMKAKTRQELYPHRETISRSFSSTLNYSLLYSTNSQYILAQIPLVFLSIFVLSLTIAILRADNSAIPICSIIIGLILLSIPTVWRVWKPSFIAWRRFKGQEFNFFPGSSIQHAVPFDPILCIQFCCPSRKHSITELAQRIHQLDQAKPILIFAVTCYPTLDSYNNANRFHVEHIPLKDLAKSKLLQYRSHLYYIGVDSFANISVPPEEVLKCQHLSSAPTYLRKEYQKRPLGAAYIELNATYSLSSDDYAWLQQCRDKLIETHSSQRFPYVDVDVLYLLDGVSPSTTDFNFFRDVENLSVVPLDLLPTALNQFSKYNTNGCNNPRGLSSYAADSVEDMDYELSMAGRAPMNTFLPIPIQLIEQYDVDEYDQRRVKLFDEWIDSQTRHLVYDDIGTAVVPAFEKTIDPTLPDEGEHWTTQLNANRNSDDSDDSETEDGHVEGKIDIAKEILKIEARHKKVAKLLQLHPEQDPETIIYHKDMDSDNEDNTANQQQGDKQVKFTVSGTRGYGSTGGTGSSSSSSKSKEKTPTNDYDTILAAIEPDLYRTSCKMSHPIQTQGIHYTQILFNQFTFIFAIALGIMSLFSLWWRSPCCSPRKYAFYHKKVLKLSQVYSLPDNQQYLTR